MELVGHVLRLEKEADGIKLDFQCTNKEVFQDILVPPLLSGLNGIPSKILRIHIHRWPDSMTKVPTQQWVLNSWGEVR